jgi:ubiquinone/menaquinone biosynthesis C-methylase UbiE
MANHMHSPIPQPSNRRMRAQALVGKARFLPFREESIDVVSLTFVVGHVANQRLVLEGGYAGAKV